ncbi:MAG: right-handed parallel beta-helix repeat-containing protein, partial [bacterium]
GGMGWSDPYGANPPYEAYFGYTEVPQISALDYSSGILFAGGQFSPDSICLGEPGWYHGSRYPDLMGNNIAMWDGSEWDSLGSGTNGPVYEIVARPGEVWVGGDFSKAGKKASHNIAHYVFDSFPDLTCIYVPGDYPTIQEAIDAATDNDTIMVAPGTYDIDAAIINNRVNNLKIYGSRQEDGSDASIIEASVNPGEHFCFSIQNVTGGEISGFEIKNGVVGVFYDNCMNCKCSNNYIHHQHTISGPDVPCGISICQSTEIEVEFCILDSNQVKGIDIWQSDHVDIINNTIVNSYDKCGCWINGSDYITVKNNILAHNDTDGIGIVNCTFTEFIHDYNCFWQNTTDPLQGYTPGTHSLESDPLFVDLSQSDYYLQTGSPCLGTGEGGVDIGALGETTSQEYENEISDMFSSQKIISTAADGAKAIYAVDLDGDGDQDVLSASSKDDKIAWYENDGSGG